MSLLGLRFEPETSPSLVMHVMVFVLERNILYKGRVGRRGPNLIKYKCVEISKKSV